MNYVEDKSKYSKPDINPYTIKAEKGGILSKEDKELNKRIRLGEAECLLSYSGNADLYIKEIKNSKKMFSFNVVSVPGFVGSLNDSFMLYGLGDQFLFDLAKMIEGHFERTSQPGKPGRTCKVFAEGVNLVIMLEGEAPADIDKQIKDVIKDGKFKYEMNLHDIPDTKDGNKIKEKIIKWAKQNEVSIDGAQRVKVDLKTIKMTSGVTERVGIPSPKVGSFDLPSGTGHTDLQIKRMGFKLIDWVKLEKGSGILSFEDNRISGLRSEDLVLPNETDLTKIDKQRVKQEINANINILKIAETYAPSEFNEELSKYPISNDTKIYLKSINDGRFLDFTYQVMNEKAYEARLDHLSKNNQPFYMFSGDITNLGGINREYGKMVGDVYLKAYSDSWKEVAMEYEKEGIKIEFARCGADEVGVIVTKIDVPGKEKANLEISDEKSMEINQKALSKVNKKVLEIGETFLSKEDLAKLKNKGIVPQGDKVIFNMGDLFRLYSKGSRYDIGSTHTMVGEKIPAGNKRSGKSLNARMKADVKAEKKNKASTGETVIVLKSSDGTPDKRFEPKYEANFSSKTTLNNSVNQYLAQGAQGGSFTAKVASIGYNLPASTGSFFVADVLFGLGVAGIDSLTGQKNVGDKFKSDIANSAKSNLAFGITDASLRAFWNANNIASPAAIFMMTSNSIAAAPEENKGLATTSGVLGLGSFIGTNMLATDALSLAFGSSTKTPGPFWIKATSFGLAYLSTRFTGVGVEALYENVPAARRVMESAPIKTTGDVLSFASDPLNVAFVTGTASKAFKLMTPGAATGGSATGAAGFGASFAAVLGVASIGTYVVVGGAEHIMLDGHTIGVAKQAKNMWKQDMNGFGQAMFTVGNFLAAPVMDAYTPEIYREKVYATELQAEKVVKEVLGNILLDSAVNNERFIYKAKESAMPHLTQYGPDIKKQFKAQLENWLKTEGALPAFKTALRSFGSDKDDKAAMAISKIYVNSKGEVDVSDAAIEALFSKATVNGKPLAVAIIQVRRK